MYSPLKVVHITAVALSGTGFMLRYVLSARGRLPVHGWTRIVPHVIDSALLASALMLLWIGSLNPLAVPWLAAKLLALPVYIVSGTIALKRGRKPRQRMIFFALALASFAYIVATALCKRAWCPLAP